MDHFVQTFEDRLREIELYLDLLDTLETQVQQGPPKLGTTTITVEQQRILYSSVYLQLYNLVELTVTRCLDAVSSALEEKQQWLPGDLSDKLRREWVRSIARTHTELNFENRLNSALDLCEFLVQSRHVSAFKIEKGAGGSWDDLTIQNISARIGLSLNISTSVNSDIKRPFRNDQGALMFIKTLRNGLAHGTVSFVESGENVTVADLRDLENRTAAYLRGW